jgi:hypothetical protein
MRFPHQSEFGFKLAFNHVRRYSVSTRRSPAKTAPLDQGDREVL